MARASAKIILFLVCLNAAATAFGASGVASDWGIDPSVGGDNFVSDLKSEAKSVGGNTGTSSFLIGLTVSFANTFLGVVEFVFAGPLMFQNAGVPPWITTFLFAPMYGLVFFDGIYIFTGRRM